MDEPLTVSLDGPWTLDEVDEIERLSGVPFPRWFDGRTREGALRRAIAFVVARRSKPDVTMAEVGQMMIQVR